MADDRDPPKTLNWGMCARSPGQSANTLRRWQFHTLAGRWGGGRDFGVEKEGAGLVRG